MVGIVLAIFPCFRPPWEQSSVSSRTTENGTSFEKKKREKGHLSLNLLAQLASCYLSPNSMKAYRPKQEASPKPKNTIPLYSSSGTQRHSIIPNTPKKKNLDNSKPILIVLTPLCSTKFQADQISFLNLDPNFFLLLTVVPFY